MTTTSSTAVVRRWARERGMAVGDRGRLAPEVLAAYEQQQAAASPAPAPAPAELVEQKATDPVGGGFRVAVRPVRGATGTSRRITARAS